MTQRVLEIQVASDVVAIPGEVHRPAVSLNLLYIQAVPTDVVVGDLLEFLLNAVVVEVLAQMTVLVAGVAETITKGELELLGWLSLTSHGFLSTQLDEVHQVNRPRIAAHETPLPEVYFFQDSLDKRQLLFIGLVVGDC